MTRVGAVICLMVVLAVGCAPKTQLRNDPFNDPNRSRSIWPWSRDRAGADKNNNARSGRESDRERDDDAAMLPPPQRSPRDDRDAASAPAPAGPLAFPEDQKELAKTPASPGAAPVSSTAPASTNRLAASDSVRQRLDRVGAKNKVLETDEATGEAYFRCLIENPKDPHILRVFEAKDKDENVAMEEVATAIEEWLAKQAPR